MNSFSPAAVLLAHAIVEFFPPAAVMLAKLGILVAIGIFFFVFDPQLAQCQIEFLDKCVTDCRYIRSPAPGVLPNSVYALWEIISLRSGFREVTTLLSRSVCRRGSSEIVSDGTPGYLTAARYFSLANPTL